MTVVLLVAPAIAQLTQEKVGVPPVKPVVVIVPVISISSEELKAFYNNEHSAHKQTRRALRTAKEENKKLKKELGNKKERDSKWLRFHENQAEAEKKVSNAT